MRQILLLAVTAAAMSQLGFASACASGSLQSYIALGSGGCTIGGDTLYNFKLLTGGATAIAASLVTINPSGTTYAPVVTISTSQTAATNAALESIFTYTISGSSFTGISALLSNSTESGFGGVTGLVNICEGGLFGPDGVTGCVQPTASLLTADGIQNSDMSVLNNSFLLNVTNDLQIDGPASGGTLTNSFTAVPEPLTSALAGLGLALVGTLKIRSIRAKERN